MDAQLRLLIFQFSIEDLFLFHQLNRLQICLQGRFDFALFDLVFKLQIIRDILHRFQKLLRVCFRSCGNLFDGGGSRRAGRFR